jgi:sec-independent protein translocase protein TatB
MFGLGIWEIAVIAVVALLVLGPQKLPDAAKSLGKALRDFRRAGEDLKREMMGDGEELPRPAPPVAIKAPENVVPAQPQEEPKPAAEQAPENPEAKS